MICWYFITNFKYIVSVITISSHSEFSDGVLVPNQKSKLRPSNPSSFNELVTTKNKGADSVLLASQHVTVGLLWVILPECQYNYSARGTPADSNTGLKPNQPTVSSGRLSHNQQVCRRISIKSQPSHPHRQRSRQISLEDEKTGRTITKEK